MARGCPDVELTHFYADNAAYQLARDPCAFDVILADNLFGDILSDQAGAIAGSLGMMLDHSFGRPEAARRIEAAVTAALDAGHRTPDIGGTETTESLTDAIIAALRR